MNVRVLWVSTSRDTAGGIATYVRTVADTPLWSEWGIRHVATHRDGSMVRKVAAFVAGGSKFTVLALVRRPDLVHLHSASYGSFARKSLLAWIAYALRIPVVIHIHGGAFPTFYRCSPRPLRAYIRATLIRAARVVALGDAWAAKVTAIAPESTVAPIPNALRTSGIRPGVRAGRNVLFLGRLVESKGAFTLLDAWSRMLVGGGRGHLVIAGSGDAARATRYARRLGIADTVDVLGWTDRAETDALLDRCQVLALPSRNEGQPMAVLEAMAHGLCVVASAVGGVPDLIDDECGVLVAPDDVEALATALRRVLDDAALRARLGDAARAKVRAEFDVDVVWRRLDALYREVLA